MSHRGTGAPGAPRPRRVLGEAQLEERVAVEGLDERLDDAAHARRHPPGQDAERELAAPDARPPRWRRGASCSGDPGGGRSRTSSGARRLDDAPDLVALARDRRWTRRAPAPGAAPPARRGAPRRSPPRRGALEGQPRCSRLRVAGRIRSCFDLLGGDRAYAGARKWSTYARSTVGRTDRRGRARSW